MRKIIIYIFASLLAIFINGQTSYSQEEFLTIDVQNILDQGNFTFDNPKGSVNVTGYDGKLILITGKLRHPSENKQEEEDLKRLDDYPFTMTAEIRGNQVLLLCESKGKTVDFDIKIPRGFSASIKSQDNGDIRIVQLAGDIDVGNPNGSISLLGITGSVNLSSVNGNIDADFKKIDKSKQIIISSLDGNIDLTIPENAKINFKLKSTNKEIKTDLEISRKNRTSIIKQGKEKKTYTMDDWTHGSLNGGGANCTLSTFNGSISIKKR